MELHATGFNAWNQLRFQDSGPDALVSEEPDDIRAFELILRHPGITGLFASVSSTIVRTSSGVQSSGYPDSWLNNRIQEKILRGTAAIAGNGTMAEVDEEAGSIRQSQIDQADGGSGEGRREFRFLRDIVQIVAYEAGFAALSRRGRVYTWGDERYGACLGRETSEACPAAHPSRVVELEDLPTGRIRRLAAGGYHVMALTVGNDLYAWGGHPGRAPLIDGVSGFSGPMPVVIEDRDIMDCDLGESHAIVLSMDGDVFVVGHNTNGQLGLDVERAESWTRVPWHSKCRPFGVGAGPRSSFIIGTLDTP